MAIENKRVIDLANESTSLAGDEYVLLDSNNTGTTKYRLSRLSDQIEDVDEAVQAEATARANAVTAEATARQTADTALEGEITDLNDDLSEQIGINTNQSTGWEQGFWYTSHSTTRQDYIRSKSNIPVEEGDVVTVDMNGYVGTEVQFNYFDGDTYSGRTTVRKANFANGVATFSVPSGVPNVRINIYSGGASIHIDPADYADVKVYINPTITVKEQLLNLNTKIPIPFEVGLITYGNAGFYYPDEQTTRRIRTIANTSISLKTGDVVKIDPSKDTRFCGGWTNASGVYTKTPWYTNDYTITEDGEYTFMVAYRTDHDITDFAEMATSVWIERSYGSYSDYLDDAKSNIIVARKIFSVANTNAKSINHRGWFLAPENTLYAFAESKYYGFDYIEADIRATSDGVLVCLHDATIDRTSNGTGNIADLTYAEVSALDFGSYKSVKYASAKIPTLDELLEFCKYVGLHPYLEVKDTLSSELIAKCVDTVNTWGMRGEVTYFGTAGVADTISQLDNDARVGIVLFRDIIESDIASISVIKNRGNKVFLDVQAGRLTSEGVELAKNANIPVECWNVVVDNVESIDKYVSGYTTDVFVVGDYMAKPMYSKYLI